MRASASKDGDLISHVDRNDESEAEIENTSLHYHLINNHDVAANKGKSKRQLPLDYIFRFCRTFKMIFKLLEFHLTFRTADLQDNIYTSVGISIKVSFY